MPQKNQPTLNGGAFLIFGGIPFSAADRSSPIVARNTKRGSTMSLYEALFGGNKETHPDGSVTERYDGGTSTTRNEDGGIRERTSHETVLPLGAGDKITVTRDGNDKVVNVQKGW
jgi:hypothetical protein